MGKDLISADVALYRNIVDRLDYSAATELFNFSPHKAQQTVLETVSSRKFDVLTLACGRRFGKSELMSVIADTELVIPESRTLLVTPTFANAKAIYDKVELAILKKGLKIKSKDIKLLTFTLEHNQTIICATPKSISNVLGFKYSLVIFDESQDINGLMDIWENKILPAQADYGLQEDGYMYSKTMFIGTVRDFDNEFYIPFERGMKKQQGYLSFNFPTSSNPYISKEFLAKKKETLPKKTYDMEYEGIWQILKGDLVYYAFTEDNILSYEDNINRLISNPSSFYLTAIDFGYNDNTGQLVGIYEKLTDTIYIVGNYKQEQLSMGEHAKNFKDLENMCGYVTDRGLRWGDPSAVQQMHDLAYTYGYFLSPAKNDVEAGILSVNNAFHNKKLMILDNCTDLILEIKNMVWKNPKTKEVLRNKRFKHFDLALSTLRYLVYSWEKQKDMSIIIL